MYENPRDFPLTASVSSSVLYTLYSIYIHLFIFPSCSQECLSGSVISSYGFQAFLKENLGTRAKQTKLQVERNSH